MAIRTRAVRPDMVFELEDGRQIAVVSEEALLQATVDVARTVNFAGGTMSLVVNRHPTGVPHEMVTVGALIQWQDRTDAKPQPEPAAPAREVEPEPAEDESPYEAGHFPTEDPDWVPVEALARELDADPEPEELEANLEREAMGRLVETAVDEGTMHEVEIPGEAVVIGAPVGARVGPQNFETPQVTETHVTHDGAGAGALPFQRDGAPGAPPPPINLADIAHGSTSAPARGASAAPAGSSEGINDGFVAEADEDESSIPEHLR